MIVTGNRLETTKRRSSSACVEEEEEEEGECNEDEMAGGATADIIACMYVVNDYVCTGERLRGKRGGKRGGRGERLQSGWLWMVRWKEREKRKERERRGMLSRICDKKK